METGVLGPISNNWIGKDLGNERSGFDRTKFVLGAGHVVLIFFMLCSITLSTLLVLFCEIMFSKSKMLQNSFAKTTDFLDDFQRDGLDKSSPIISLPM